MAAKVHNVDSHLIWYLLHFVLTIAIQISELKFLKIYSHPKAKYQLSDRF